MVQDSNILVLRSVSPLKVSYIRKDNESLACNILQLNLLLIAPLTWAVERSTQGENEIHKYGEVPSRRCWSNYSLTD